MSHTKFILPESFDKQLATELDTYDTFVMMLRKRLPIKR